MFVNRDVLWLLAACIFYFQFCRVIWISDSILFLLLSLPLTLSPLPLCLSLSIFWMFFFRLSLLSYSSILSLSSEEPAVINCCSSFFSLKPFLFPADCSKLCQFFSLPCERVFRFLSFTWELYYFLFISYFIV